MIGLYTSSAMALVSKAMMLNLYVIQKRACSHYQCFLLEIIVGSENIFSSPVLFLPCIALYYAEVMSYYIKLAGFSSNWAFMLIWALKTLFDVWCHFARSESWIYLNTEATKRGMGAVLLRKPAKLARLVSGIAQESALPFTVKIRTGAKGISEINLDEVGICKFIFNELILEITRLHVHPQRDKFLHQICLKTVFK